jgi:hypothetical protein
MISRLKQLLILLTFHAPFISGKASGISASMSVTFSLPAFSALATSAGCARRLCPAVRMDLPEVRNPIGDVSSRSLPACRCDQNTNSYADPHTDGQRNGFAEYVRFFFAAKCVSRTTDAVGRSTIRVPDLAFDVIHVVGQTISQGVKQAESSIEQDVKEWFSLSESHGVS